MPTTVDNSPTQLDDFIRDTYHPISQLTEIWPKTDKSKLPPRSQKVLQSWRVIPRTFYSKIPMFWIDLPLFFHWAMFKPRENLSAR